MLENKKERIPLSRAVKEGPHEEGTLKLILTHQRDSRAKTTGKPFQRKGKSQCYVQGTKEKGLDDNGLERQWGNEEYGMENVQPDHMAPPGLRCQVQLYLPPNANHLAWTPASLCSSKKLPLSLPAHNFSFPKLLLPPCLFSPPYLLNCLSKKTF